MANKKYFEDGIYVKSTLDLIGDGVLNGNLSVSGDLNLTQKINFSSYNSSMVDGDLVYDGSSLIFTQSTNNVDLLDKIGKITGATGNLPMFDSEGNLIDSGIEATTEEFDYIDLIEITGITSNTLTSILSKYTITSVVLNETSGSSITVNIGTETGTTDIVNGEVVDANELKRAAIGKDTFSLTENQFIYIESDDWSNSSLDVYIKIERFAR
jgi:hypothetical protein